jgi:hypothetical protein
MQTTTSTHRFGFNRVTGSLAAVGIAAAFVAGIVGGAIGQAALDDTDSANSASAPQAIVRPKSYDNPGQGEGAMANTSTNSALIEAHHTDGMGEGWLAHGRPATTGYVDQATWRLREMNELPSTMAPERDPRTEQIFLEMNLDLPGVATSAAPVWRTIEANQWGENFILDDTDTELVPPSPDDIPQHHDGQIAY